MYITSGDIDARLKLSKPYSIRCQRSQCLLTASDVFLLCSEVSGNAHLVAHRILDKLSQDDRLAQLHPWSKPILCKRKLHRCEIRGADIGRCDLETCEL